MALVLMASTNAFAVTDDELISACLKTGIEKLKMHADVGRCKMNVEEVEASAIDNRWYNPNKYVWYAAIITCDSGEFELEKMVQYYAGKCL